MDSFTKTILARAKERQRMLANSNNKSDSYESDENTDQPLISSPLKNVSPRSDSRSTPDKNMKFDKTVIPERLCVDECQTEQVSKNKLYDFPGSSSNSPVINTLNIQKDNVNMEIRVQSKDRIRLEVEFEDSSDSEPELNAGLRQDVKDRLNRLGKLYAGGEDANISSPIHRTEEKFARKCELDQGEVKTLKERTNFGKGLRRLANLAEEINHWEDEVKPKNASPEVRQFENSKPVETSTSKIPPPFKPTRMSMVPSTPIKDRINKLNNKTTQKNETEKQASTKLGKNTEKALEKSLKWDRAVLDTLESQGFKRNAEDAKLTYQYSPQKNREKQEKISKFNCHKEVLDDCTVSEKSIKNPPVAKSASNQSIAEKAAQFEPSQKKSSPQDPSQLSILERKALFEKNKDVVVPKAPFAMAIPINANKNLSNPSKPVVIPNSTEKKSQIQSRANDRSWIKQDSGDSNKDSGRQRSPLKQLQPSVSESVRMNRKSNASDSPKKNCSPQGTKGNDVKYTPNKQIHEAIMEESHEDIPTDDEDMQDEENIPKPRRSGSKRHSVSPKVAAVLGDVKRIRVSPAKPGALYPNLSDIEATTETETEDKSQTTSSSNNSSIGSYSEEDCNTSFGKDLMEAICKNKTFEETDINDRSTCSDLSDVLDDMDNYLDEALAYSEANNYLEPSPSKQTRPQNQSCTPTNVKSSPLGDRNNFKSPIKPFASPKTLQIEPHQQEDEVLPLTHTVSFYRKQTSNTPTKPSATHQIIRNISTEPVQNDNREAQIVLEKIKTLQDEVQKQQMIITQTSQALNLCNNTLEFMGSTEQVEAEKVLLLSTHRRQAILNEIQRLKVEGTLKPQNKDAEDVAADKSTICVSNITLPLKKEYVRALAAAGGKGHHVVCLLKSGEEVVSSRLISTVASDMKNPCYELSVPGDIMLKNTYSDATMTLEVYCLQAQEEILSHEVKYHIRKNKTTPKKSKYDSHLSRFMKESPAGPQAVRSSSFALMGYVVFSLQQINKKTWSLNNTPMMSPLEGSVEMSISCEIKSSVEHRGFLTMFEDISGFGAWHRRWCLLKGNLISYWKYPDDEKKTAPINSIDLQSSITKEVGPVTRDICARPNTFLIETVREASPHDKSSLVLIRDGDRTIIRHLLSADTKPERIAWCAKLNSALLSQKLGRKNIR